jgi:beta-galactosidase
VYVPVEWLKPGKNEIVVFELIKPQQNVLKGIGKPILNVVKNNSIVSALNP